MRKKLHKTLFIVTAIVGAFSTIVKAQVSNGMDFDGTNDKIVSNSASKLIANSGGISLTCWVFLTDTAPKYPKFDGIVGIRNDINADFYILQYSKQTLEVRFRNSSGTSFNIVSKGRIELNIWQHLAMTYDGKMLRFYLNGFVSDSLAANGTITNSTLGFEMGHLNYPSGQYYMHGQLDEVSFWSKTLNQNEIQCAFNNSIDTAAANLQLYYRFNQGIAAGTNSTITTISDSKKHIDGVITNMAMTGVSSNIVAGTSDLLEASCWVPVSVSSVQQNKSLEIFPNPAQNILSIFLPSNNSYTNYSITNLHGKDVLNGKFSSNEGQAAIDISTLTQGVYFIKINLDNQQVETRKIVKL